MHGKGRVYASGREPGPRSTTGRSGLVVTARSHLYLPKPRVYWPKHTSATHNENSMWGQRKEGAPPAFGGSSGIGVSGSGHGPSHPVG